MEEASRGVTFGLIFLRFSARFREKCLTNVRTAIIVPIPPLQEAPPPPNHVYAAVLCCRVLPIPLATANASSTWGFAVSAFNYHHATA